MNSFLLKILKILIDFLKNIELNIRKESNDEYERIDYKKTYPNLSNLSIDLHQRYEDELYSGLIINSQTKALMSKFWNKSKKFHSIRKKLYNKNSNIESFYTYYDFSSIECEPRVRNILGKRVKMIWMYQPKTKKYLICINDTRYEDFEPVYFDISDENKALDLFIERVKKVHPKYERFILEARSSCTYLGEFDYLFDVGFFDHIGTDDEEKNNYLKDSSHNFQYDYEMENLFWKNKYETPREKMDELNLEYMKRKALE